MSEITVVIPTHRRSEYLRRILEYYRSEDFPIIVADSSDEHFNGLKHMPPNVTYLHFPGIDYTTKVHKTLQFVKTPFMVFCADDDFVVPYAIRYCVKFLKENSDYSSCQGLYGGFKFVNHKSLSCFPIYTHIDGTDIDSSSAADRICDYMRNYFQTFYTVHKTSNIRRVFDVSHQTIFNYNLIEFLMGLLPMIDGKHKVLPVFFALREAMEVSGGTTTDNLDIIVSNEKYSDEYSAFVKIVAENMSMTSGINKDEAYDVVQRAVDLYLGQLKPKEISVKKITRVGKIVNITKNCLFPVYSFVIARIYSLKCTLQGVRTLHRKGYPLSNNINRTELKKIFHVVRNCHNL